MPDGLAISAHAAIEGIELGVVLVRLRIDLRGARVTQAALALRVAIRFRQYHRALTICFGTDALGSLGAFRAQLTRYATALLPHAVEHGVAHLVRQIEPLHPDVHDADAEL